MYDSHLFSFTATTDPSMRKQSSLEFRGGENSSDILLLASLREHCLQDGQGSESEAGECGGGNVGCTETVPPQDAAGQLTRISHRSVKAACEARMKKSDKKYKIYKLTRISYL